MYEKQTEEATIQRQAGKISETLNFAFKIHKYARYRMEGVTNPTLNLRTDMVIRLWHHEASAYLSGSMNPRQKTCYLHRSAERIQEDEEALSRAQSFWQLEACVPVSGAVAQWSGFYRLRHTMSLKYLKVGEPMNSDDGFSYFSAELVELNDIDNEASSEDASRTVFQYVNTESQTGDFLERDDSTFRIRHVFGEPTQTLDGRTISECWLHRKAGNFGPEQNVDPELLASEDEDILNAAFRDVSGRPMPSSPFYRTKLTLILVLLNRNRRCVRRQSC